MKTNHVTLIGYLGQHLNSSTLSNGNKRIAIRVATHDSWKNQQGEKHYHTLWHDIVAWNSTAEYAECNFVKGSKIMVEGSTEYRTFPDKPGHLRYHTRIKAHSLMNLDR